MAPEIPLPTDFIGLPARVASVEIDLKSVKSRLSSAESTLNTTKTSLSNTMNNVNNLTTRVNSDANRLNNLISQVNGIRGMTPNEVSLLANFNQNVKNIVTPAFIKGAIDMPYVRGLIDAGYITSLGIPDMDDVTSKINSMVPGMITGAITQDYVKRKVDAAFVNLSDYDSLFPRLDSIPGIQTSIGALDAFKNKLTDDYIKGLISSSLISNRLSALTSGIGDLKSRVSSVQSQVAAMNTYAKACADHFASLYMNLDDWITGGPDGVRPSPTDMGAWKNLFQALLNSVTDIKNFMTQFSSFKTSIDNLKSSMDGLKLV